MAKSRIRYSKDFKANAVGMVALGRDSLTQTARTLGISPGMLSKWIKAANGKEPVGGNPAVTSEFGALANRVERLEESVRILRRILETNLRDKAYRTMA